MARVRASSGIGMPSATSPDCNEGQDWDAEITGLTAEGADYYGYDAIQWDWDDLSDGEDPPETCEDQGLVTCSDGSCAATAEDCPEDPWAECAANGGNVGWLGDGWCDSINNNEACGYDLGDCCPTECAEQTANNCPDNPDGCYSNCADGTCCGDCSTCEDPNAVSYTHLTLPTKA